MGNVRMRWTATDETGPATASAAAGAEKVGTSLADVAKRAVGAYLSFQTLKQIIVGSVKAFADQEQADARLAASLKIVGDSSRGTFEALKAQAGALQAQLGITDEAAQGLQSLALTMGILPGNIDRVVRSALDLSAGLGIDAEAALRMISKGLAGSTEAFKRHNIVLDESKIKQGGLNELLDQLGGHVGGQAAAQADTLAGQMKKFGAAVGEVQETLGAQLVPGGTFNLLTDWANRFNDGLKSIIGLQTVMGGRLAALASLLVDLFERPGEALANYEINLADVAKRAGEKYRELFGDPAASAAAATLKEANQKANETEEERAKAAAARAKRVSKAYEDEVAAAKNFKHAVEGELKKEKDARQTELKDKLDLMKATDEQEKERLAAAVAARKVINKAKHAEDVEQFKKMEKANEDFLRRAKEETAAAADAGGKIGSALVGGIFSVIAAKSEEERIRAIAKFAIRAAGATFAAILSTIGGPWGAAAAAIIQAVGAGAESLFHTGGVVGVGPLPRAHGGAVIGGRDEVPIIAQAGEGIINAAAMQRAAAAMNRGEFGGTTNVYVSAMDALSFRDYVGTRGDRGLYSLALSGRGRTGLAMRRLMGVRP